MNYNEKENKALVNRLKRIEGQVKGIQKMVENKKYCSDILIQITAARAALERVGGMILEEHVKTCIKGAVQENNDEKIDELIDIMLKYMK